MFKLNVPLQTLYPSVVHMPCFECEKDTLYLVIVEAVEDAYKIHLACVECKRATSVDLATADLREVQGVDDPRRAARSLDLPLASVACDKCGHLMAKEESTYCCAACGNVRLESDFS